MFSIFQQKYKCICILISIEFLLCLRWIWNKQGGIGRFENDIDFLTSGNKFPWFYFFRIKVTLPYSSYFYLKIITRIYLKIFGWQYFEIFVIEPQTYVKPCLKKEITLFLEEIWKNDGNAWET